ncbi:MAG: NAD-dependent epimerase/dehydratase family protein [Planctomycetota bacterium]
MRALVTGAGGFLGGAITRQLLERSDEVRSLARGAYPELEALGVETRRGSVADVDDVFEAAEGCDIVFHVAAKAGIWGPKVDYFRTNVVGTRNVLAVCQKLGIERLVYTSSPSVVFSGGDIEGRDESLPYPERYLAAYPETKARAEQEVLAANGPSLRTVALRPHLIWGPGDNHLVPRLIARAKAGQLRLVAGGRGRVDSVYIDDAARAHLLAADAIAAVDSPAAGQAYFISQGEPWTMRDLLNGILEAAGLPPESRSIPGPVAYFAGALMELSYRARGKTEEPRMTRFLAHQLARAHWFDITAARRDLGYEPSMSIHEGLERLRESLRETRAHTGP